jgi:KaiC/GvpD/RAD55 family RecA-like ATPase
MAVPTGAPMLDRMLNGGYPESRAVAVTGTPGTGKSTLSMQFLQAGLDDGDDCLYISTEQDVSGLYEGFGSFDFELTHENLRILSLQTGRTSTDDDGPMMSFIDAEGNVVDGESFTEERVRLELDRYGPFDRVVVDSVSSLEAVLDTTTYREELLDLIEILTDEFGATTVLTSEYVGANSRSGDVEAVHTEDVIQYTVDGVVRLWRERRRGELRRFLDVMKMRGVDHDTRQYEIMFSDSGLEVVPEYRTFPSSVVDRDHQPTGIDGLDPLLAGGLPKGESTLLEHDGEAIINEPVLLSGIHAIDDGMRLVLIPRANVSKPQVDAFLDDTQVGFEDTDAMLDAGHLFVIDPLDAWPAHTNVYKPDARDEALRETLHTIRECVDGSGLFLALNTEIKAHTMPWSEVRRFRYWVASQFLSADDLLLDIHNPDIMEPQLAELYSDAASVAIETWIDDTGLQYLRVKKATVGDVGSVRLVTYSETFPYIEVR